MKIHRFGPLPRCFPLTFQVIYLELWGGGGGGSSPSHLAGDVDVWICGGGGGAAAAVSLTWHLEKGHKYRIEFHGVSDFFTMIFI